MQINVCSFYHWMGGTVRRGLDHREDGDCALGQIAVPGRGFQEEEWRHRAAALQHR